MLFLPTLLALLFPSSPSSSLSEPASSSPPAPTLCPAGWRACQTNKHGGLRVTPAGQPPCRESYGRMEQRRAKHVLPRFVQQDCASGWPRAASESCGSVVSTKTGSLVCCPGGWTAQRLQAPPARRRSWVLAPPCTTSSRSGAITLCVATVCTPLPLARHGSPVVACMALELALIER